jgi:hypothetical protein
MEWNIGDSVFVVADNYGSPAIIIEYREATGSPPSHWKVRTDTGDEFWALDFEISLPAYDSTGDTLAHIRRVQTLLDRVCIELARRAAYHDASKLQEPEKSMFDRMTPLLKTLTYGSDEYKAALVEMGTALDHHYAHNSHHPQHYPNGISGMSLLDVIEMLVDWKAAGERHADGDMPKSLVINKGRFDLSDQFAQILENTVKELGW